LVVDNAGYPSSFAAGGFSSTSPNLRMQALEVTRQIPVTGSATLHSRSAPMS
jgi:hypothetical protein